MDNSPLRLLVQDGSLEHVTRHLRDSDVHALRSTCRDLRYNRVIMASFEQLHTDEFECIDPAVDLPFLTRMPNLHTLRFECPYSCWRLHALSSFHQLRHLGLIEPGWPNNPGDLAPIASLTQLQSLSVCSGRAVFNLGHLSSCRHLSALELEAGAGQPGIRQLRCLRRLSVEHVKLIPEAAELPHLSHLEVAQQEEVADAAQFNAAWQHMQGMTALRTLVAHDQPALPVVLQLTQLRTLFLGQPVEGGVLDLSLPNLELLGVTCDAQVVLIAPSCTCIKLCLYLRVAGRAQLPTMHACSRLIDLHITGYGAHDVEIAAAKLPPQHISIGANISGQLFAEAFADKRFRLKRSGSTHTPIFWPEEGR